MIPPGSRYEFAERLFSEAHSYNEYGYPFLEGETPNLKIKVTPGRRPTSGCRRPSPASRLSTTTSRPTSRRSGWLTSSSGTPSGGTRSLTATAEIWYPLDMKQGDYIGIPVQHEHR